MWQVDSFRWVQYGELDVDCGISWWIDVDCGRCQPYQPWFWSYLQYIEKVNRGRSTRYAVALRMGGSLQYGRGEENTSRWPPRIGRSGKLQFRGSGRAIKHPWKTGVSVGTMPLAPPIFLGMVNLYQLSMVMTMMIGGWFIIVLALLRIFFRTSELLRTSTVLHT